MLLATFLLTIFRDLTEGILVGFALGAVLFINRMAEMTGIEADTPLVAADRADDGNGERVPYDAGLAADPDVLVYRITGAFFFGAASTVGDGARQHRRQPQGVRGRFRGRAVPRFHRGQCDEPGCGKGQAAGHPAVHHRRVADGAPCAADPRRQPAARAIPRDHRACGRRHQAHGEKAAAAPDVLAAG